jgi:adenylate kinase family enzyme
MKKRELENEKKLLEKEQQEKELQIMKIEREKESIEKSREILSNEFTESIFEIVNNFSKEEEKWIDSLQGPEIENKISKLKAQLDNLFDILFENEKVMRKINNKFINVIKTSFTQKELNKMNFIIIGSSGVGKSTLTNEIFGEKLAQEGNGKRTTTESTKYESELVPFLSLLDTMGTEIGTGHKLIDVLDETLNEISNKLDSKDPNDHIHCILYCTTSNRFFKDELEVILKLRQKYDGKKLPIVIVYTRATKDEDVDSIKETINEFLNDHGESLSDDIFGITFIKVNAREERSEHMGLELYTPCFGLSNLMKTCFKKGEKSYRYAIKNSLIQIGKNSIKEYLDIIHSKLVNNLNNFNYLYNQFEPNFPNYIAYCFEKITDINEQKGIQDEELEGVQNYLTNYQIGGEQNELSTIPCIPCMFCNKSHKNILKCLCCESELCEDCYLQQIQNSENIICANCSQGNFEEIKENEKENKDKDKNDLKKTNIEDKNIQILNNNLNIVSRNTIKNYIEGFKNEFSEILDQKFKEFANQASEKIYTKILEKYIKLNENGDKVERMENIGDFKAKAVEEINKSLKEKSKENFLRKIACHFFQDIVEKFQQRCENKLNDYINNLLENDEANKFFEECDELNKNKELKFKKELDEYIRNLQKKEEESQQKALKKINVFNMENQSNSSCESDNYFSRKA